MAVPHGLGDGLVPVPGVTRMWPAYQQTRWRQAPFLFFGIKLYRLCNWSHAARKRLGGQRSQGDQIYIAVLRLCSNYELSCDYLSLVPHQLSAVAKASRRSRQRSSIDGLR